MRSIYESESDESFFIDVETRESFVSVEELMGGGGGWSCWEGVGEGEVEIGERCRWQKPEHQRRLEVTGTGTGTGTIWRCLRPSDKPAGKCERRSCDDELMPRSDYCTMGMFVFVCC
jgi:hypothetical protein